MFSGRRHRTVPCLPGGGSALRSGLIDRVKASLEAESIPYFILGGVQPNPRSGLVYEGIELCRKEKIDFVLTVGGGSVIDSSKAIAAGSVYEGDFWDFYSGKLIEKALPVGTVLTMVHEGPRVIADPNNYDARANIMWAGMMAHNNSCGVGRTQDWNSHNIEHELSALYDCAHGAGLAVTLPAVFTYVMNHDVKRFAQVAVRVWGCQMDFYHPEVTALEGIEKMRNFFISIGMPRNFAELGAREEDIPTLVKALCYGNGRQGSISGFVTLGEEDCAKIYQMMV